MGSFENAIVTGPTGVLGAALVEWLVDEGVSVKAVIRSGSERAGYIRHLNGIDTIECDLADLSELPSKITDLTGETVFFHLGWKSTFGIDERNDVDTQMANIAYCVEAVRAAVALGCIAFIGVGSQAEYGRVEDPLSPSTPTRPENAYGIAKLCAGQMSRIECEKLGIRHNWVRVLSLYGPHDNPKTLIASSIVKLLKGQKPSLTRGEQIWDYLCSKDAANALFAVAKTGKPSATYCLGSAEPRQLREYIECLRDAIDPALEIGFGDIDYSENQVMYLCADIANLKRDTGFVPSISFETGIRETIEWYRRVCD